jgi:hypothetical protein
MEDKIIVTNRKALLRKYGSNGFATIQNALTELMIADNKRGIKSKVVYLDDKASMKKLSGKAVISTTDLRGNKEAIDVVFKFFNPHYLMILGAPDVVPYQDLDNPVYGLDSDGDEDKHAWSDLPYACDAPYSRDPAHFVGPTRIVGRLPDLVSASEPSYLVSLLKTTANYKRRSRDNYMGYFGLSAEVWEISTKLSLDNIFGNADKLLLAPPSGPDYADGQLQSRMHFINCHGDVATPEFYGEGDNSKPISLTTQAIAGKIVDGTVAAVECCYGSELYDAVTLGIDQPISQSYLYHGSYGYFGSTTIAYGPPDGNGAADLICQYFLLNVLDSASIGRAALKARQQFVGDAAQMDPFDLKTLAQFCLLGDPSVHPVDAPSATDIPAGVARAEAERFLRAERREKMKVVGAFLAETKPIASKRVPSSKLSPAARALFSRIAQKAQLGGKVRFTAFAVKGAQRSKSRYRAAKAPTAPSHYLVAIGTPRGETMGKIKNRVAVVAKELNGRIVDYRIYHKR